MTRISPTRIAEVFRTLSSTSSSKAHQSSGKKADKSDKSQANTAAAHSEKLLRKNLVDRLRRLKQESDDFEKDAPLVAIREVILWEFGEESIEHPEFKYVIQQVTEQIVAHPELQVHMAKMLDSLLEGK